MAQSTRESLEVQINALRNRFMQFVNTGAGGAGAGAAMTSLTGDVNATGPGAAAATLATSGVTAGTYGDSTHVAQVTVDATGRITAVSLIAISGGGSYTDENAQDAVGGALLDSTTIDFTYDDFAGTITADLKAGSVANSVLANMAQATIKGRVSGAGTGVPSDLTANQVSTVLDSATDPFLRTSAAVASLSGCIEALLFAVGDLAFVQLPWNFTAAKWEITGFDATGGSVNGSAVVDVWNDSDANYPPTVADTIATGHKPTLASAVKAIDSGIAWSLLQYSWIVFKFESKTTVDHVLVQVFGTKS